MKYYFKLDLFISPGRYVTLSHDTIYLNICVILVILIESLLRGSEDKVPKYNFNSPVE